MNNNIKFEKSEEFIYEMISKRFKIRKNYYNLKNYEILPNDPQLASNILNNKRTSKKNPYLITATYFDEIQKNLGFSTLNEMLWGDKFEFKSYSGYLFYLLIKEILASDSSIKKILTSLLIEYAPFAKNKCLEDFLEKEDGFIGNKEDFLEGKEVSRGWVTFYYSDWIIESADKEELYCNAIGRLYSEIEYDFINAYLGYFNDKNTIKLNKKLNEFVQNDLLYIFKEKHSNIASSIGLLVYNSMNEYLQQTPTEVEYIMYLPGNYHNTCTPETEEDFVVVFDDLKELCLSFIDGLIKIQNRLEFSSYKEWLDNDWKEYDYLDKMKK
ncbi:hypothetical protein ACIZ62_15690 [Acetobacterium carbinolicum]|uniref:hypothetical protein n=1 Tax=Acetobacterium carbinolicum TaxID=52690 RepID=UPI0039BFA7E3